jgi:lipoprotein Spr
MTPVVGERAARFVAAARELVGVPYRHAGRNKHGVDCGGVIILAARRAGLIPADWDVLPYSTIIDVDMILAGLREWCEPVEAAAAGDILLMRILRRPQHLAIASGEGSIIHCYTAAGRVVEHPLTVHWRQAIVGIFRWRPAGGGECGGE